MAETESHLVQLLPANSFSAPHFGHVNAYIPAAADLMDAEVRRSKLTLTYASLAGAPIHAAL
jgi:hypothetical protein